MPRANRSALPAALVALVLGLQPGAAPLRASNPVAETPAPPPAPPPFPPFQAVLGQILAQPDVQQAWAALVARKAQGDAAGVAWARDEQETLEAALALDGFLHTEKQFMLLCLAKLMEQRQHWVAQGHPETASLSYMWHLAILVGANLCRRVDGLLSGPS